MRGPKTAKEMTAQGLRALARAKRGVVAMTTRVNMLTEKIAKLNAQASR